MRELTTFGLKLAGYFHAEFARNKERLKTARAEVATAMVSGAMGTFAHQQIRMVEAHVAAKLGLRVETVSTQVIPRDRHAAYFAALAVVASSLERLATEVRHLQRTEALKRRSSFHSRSAQVASSAMPHKRNPILSENIVGLARVVRSYAGALAFNRTWRCGTSGTCRILRSSGSRRSRPMPLVTLDFALVRMAGRPSTSSLIRQVDRTCRSNPRPDAGHRAFSAALRTPSAGRCGTRARRRPTSLARWQRDAGVGVKALCSSY